MRRFLSDDLTTSSQTFLKGFAKLFILPVKNFFGFLSMLSRLNNDFFIW
jgi:hypothetical protein